MSKHDHVPPPPPCKHESLLFCAQCDAVECTACGKEWTYTSQWASLNSPRTWTKPIPLPGISGQTDPTTRMQQLQNLGLCSHVANERQS